MVLESTGRLLLGGLPSSDITGGALIAGDAIMAASGAVNAQLVALSLFGGEAFLAANRTGIASFPRLKIITGGAERVRFEATRAKTVFSTNVEPAATTTYDWGTAALRWNTIFMQTATVPATPLFGGALNHNGSVAGFYGAPPAPKPTVNGSRGGNAALASLLSALSLLGLITDNTTPCT